MKIAKFQGKYTPNLYRVKNQLILGSFESFSSKKNSNIKTRNIQK